MAMKPEAKVKQAIKRMLREEFPQVWTYWPVSNGMGAHGIPDLIMCAGGRFFGIEVKALGGKVTPLQADQLRRISESDGVSMTLIGMEGVERLRVMLNCMYLPRTQAIAGVEPVVLSQDEYEAIAVKDPNKLYHVIAGAKP